MKKSLAKIIFSEGRYRYEEADSKIICNLSLFLATDVGFRRASFFKEWSLEENHETSGGNISFLFKEDGFVFIGDLYSEEEDGGPYLKISIENFVKILDQWEQFYKTNPKEVLLTYENGVVTMEGKD